MRPSAPTLRISQTRHPTTALAGFAVHETPSCAGAGGARYRAAGFAVIFAFNTARALATCSDCGIGRHGPGAVAECDDPDPTRLARQQAAMAMAFASHASRGSAATWRVSEVRLTEVAARATHFSAYCPLSGSGPFRTSIVSLV
jgi:hypothetical protein